MTVGILLAGGIGERVGAGIPKQFIEISEKPICWYPLKNMEECEQIDAIEVVCVREYMEQMRKIVRDNGFKKVKWIIPGGATCQESTYNGIKNLKGVLTDDDIILIHMTSYPLATSDTMAQCIGTAKEKGNGCAVRPVLTTLIVTEDGVSGGKTADPHGYAASVAPYAFRFGECSRLYDEAYESGHGIAANCYTNTLYCDNGKKLYFVRDTQMNLKITTLEDILFMKAILALQYREHEGEASVNC